MKRFSQFRQREGNRFKQRLVPFFNGVYGIYAKLRKAIGNPIVISDASDEALFGLRVFGKSTQNGTPTPDAPVEIVSVENPKISVDNQTLSVPYILHGIPVTSGGNYTDANGQQWICDEVDFERGVYVQRCGLETTTIVFNEEDTSGRFVATRIFNNYHYKSGISPCICNVSKWTSSAMLNQSCCVGGRNFYYMDNSKTLSEINELFSNLVVQTVAVLFNPIETPLTAAQIEAYKALHTNEPNTTILNDQNAWMEVMYTSK